MPNYRSRTIAKALAKTSTKAARDYLDGAERREAINKMAQEALDTTNGVAKEG